MERNISNPNQYQKEDSSKKKDNKPAYFWVSYPDDPKEEKTKHTVNDSLLERSNRFAL